MKVPKSRSSSFESPSGTDCAKAAIRTRRQEVTKGNEERGGLRAINRN